MKTNKITTREKEVLKLIANEYTTHEIANELYLSDHTVITHRRNLLRKLDAKNIGGLIRRAFELRILQVENQFLNISNI